MEPKLYPGDKIRVLSNYVGARKSSNGALFCPGDEAVVKFVVENLVIVESPGWACSPVGFRGDIADAQALQFDAVELIFQSVIEDPFFRELLGD